MSNPVVDLIDEWQRLRSEIAEMERADHPDITDRHGRVWTWWKGTLYRHCSLAFPQSFVEDERLGLPNPKLRDNPNYTLCQICLPD
ncbi:hypothetical protein [Streptomyces sp. NPDC055912]|uniref:hypothetical protein n=1 Tax=Streptomyces sp. NPDC055912 TaxID=3345660 RepID=UPI0035DE8858